jgi:hypothetical protein
MTETGHAIHMRIVQGNDLIADLAATRESRGASSASSGAPTTAPAPMPLSS